MKDREGTELVKGDPVMLIIDTPVLHPAEIVMFLEMELETTGYDSNDQPRTKVTDTLLYYPITEEGLQVAKNDNGTVQTGFYRTEKFTASNIKPKHLLKMEDNFRGFAKTLFDDITAEL